MLKLPICDVPFAFLDTETTGISSSRGARVCEIAILSVQNGRRLDLFQTLINPDCPIEWGAQQVHGISDEMVAQSPTFSEIAPKVREILQGKAMVCHNAPFDLSFLRSEFERAGRPMPAVPVIDTLKLARRHFSFGRNNLGHIAQALGVEPNGWHRAGNDVRLTHEVFRHFLLSFRRKGARTLEDLLKL